MVPTRQERTEAVTKMRREQILSAGLEVFTRKGFSGATTAEIAKSAGVAQGTIFKYFPTKRNLFVAVIKNFVLTMPLMDLIDHLPQGNVSETLQLIIEDRMRLIEQGEVSRLPMLIADVMRDRELKEEWVRDFLQPFMEKMEGVYRFMGMNGMYRGLEPAVAVRAVGGMILGFLLFKILEGDTSPLKNLPAEKVQQNFAEVLLRGVLGNETK